ncbi:hypothetical protein [Butyrivibrio sp. MC2021]|uniref:hypothetical protein n=1 Tax=Butyrivibrio sp. MC2021 TaxID=1408306 RepID=UPI00047AEB0C|nr:hypothetical protein [Butyrivibrio sp. MC2021]
MIIFVYTFILVFFASLLIFGLGTYLNDCRKAPEEPILGEVTAAMCTTRLLGKEAASNDFTEEDFIIEQDLVYTYDSVNL